MGVIEQGNVITEGVEMIGTGPQKLSGHGVPTGKYIDIAQAGAVYVDADNDNVYENQGSIGTPSWVRIDTV